MPEYSARIALGQGLDPVGHLRFTQAGPRQFSTFAYDRAWIENGRAFAVQPDLPLEGGPFYASGQAGNTRDALAGVFVDAAPDSWGRRLLERAYGNGLTEFEYLTLSDDTCRQGALRFLDDQGEIIRGGAPDAVPRLVDLESITAIARAYEQGRDISAQDGVLVTAVQKVPLSNSLESRRLKHFSRRKYLILLMAKVFQFAFLIWAAGGPPSRRRPR